MLGFHKKTRAELMREEMGQSWDHFLQAATHAAGGVGASFGPTTGRMRRVTSRGMDSTMSALTPLAAAYREGAADAMNASKKAHAKARKHKKGGHVSRSGNTGMLIGLLAAGAAVGIAGALVMKRRRQQQWSEYDPSQALETMRSETKSMTDKTAGKADSVIDKATHHTSKAMDKTADKLHEAASSLKGGGRDTMKSKVNDAAEAANDATDSFASKYSSSGSKNGRM
ncbi:hypothetical protein [Catellatospora sichuanensis]|uniref:hypothetical protein n=1 Tax=Catellatospora sichuanensis TaxID=1969805 RepID=UPI00118374C4|nr:hypothetical protein [Catellatospora sichuanensis]